MILTVALIALCCRLYQIRWDLLGGTLNVSFWDSWLSKVIKNKVIGHKWNVMSNLIFLIKNSVSPAVAKILKLSVPHDENKNDVEGYSALCSDLLSSYMLTRNIKSRYLLSTYGSVRCDVLWFFLFVFFSYKKLFQVPVCKMIFSFLLWSFCSAASVFRESKRIFRCSLK